MQYEGTVPTFEDKVLQRAVAMVLEADVPQVTVVQAVEKFSHINFQDPPTRHLHRLVVDNSQRLMRRAAGPKAV